MHLALLILLSTPPPEFEAEVPVVTVCDVLANRKQYLNSDVIVVGRFEHRGSLTDAYDYLVENGCKQPVITKTETWQNEIFIAPDEEEDSPVKAPSDEPPLDRLLIAKRLAEVRQKTALGTHKGPLFKSENGVITFDRVGDLPNEWAATYGRIFFSNELGSESCDDDLQIGCEGFGGAPIAIVVNSNGVHFLNEDGQFRKSSKP